VYNKDDSSIPIFLADEITCAEATSTCSSLTKVWDESHFDFPLVYGVSPDEPELLKTLNYAISIFNKLPIDKFVDLESESIGDIYENEKI